MMPRSLLASVMFCGSLLYVAGFVQAQEFGSPGECQVYTGDAYVKCLHAYIEMQQNKITQIEEAIHGRNGAPAQMQMQVDRQTAVTQEDLQTIDETPGSLAPMPVAVPPSVAPGYAYAGYGYPGVRYYGYGYPVYGTGLGLSLYPGLGLSLNLGVPRYYGRPFYGPRFYYRPRAFYGPGFYGPRFFGPRFSHGSRFYGSRFFGHHR